MADIFASIRSRIEKLELAVAEQELRTAKQESRVSELASTVRRFFQPSNSDSTRVFESEATIFDEEDSLSDQEEPSSANEAYKQTMLPLNHSNFPTVERYRKDGQIAVIISKGYGRGWSREHCLRRSIPLEAHLHEFLLFNKDVVAAVLQDDLHEAVRICRERFEALGMGEEFRGLGRRGLAVEWIDERVDFRVTVCAGYESICFRDEVEWDTA